MGKAAISDPPARRKKPATAPRPRAFLLSPASAAGRRARMLLEPRSAFDLAVRLHGGGVPLGELFAFLSGLYFRGKLAYARAFAGPRGTVRVITTDRGLMDPDLLVTLADLRAMASGTVDHTHEPYRVPLVRDAEALRAALPRRAEVVLLGSIATPKYVDVLTAVFGRRLVFPTAFVGRGDMSRGGLMLRQVATGVELEYQALLGAERRGRRPPKLTPAGK